MDNEIMVVSVIVAAVDNCNHVPEDSYTFGIFDSYDNMVRALKRAGAEELDADFWFCNVDNGDEVLQYRYHVERFLMNETWINRIRRERAVVSKKIPTPAD